MNTTSQRTVARIITSSAIGLLVFALFALPVLASAGKISPTDKYAWSETAGWLNLHPQDGGVTVYPDHLEGYAWAANFGWVKLGSHRGGGAHTYANTNSINWGVNHDGVGHLSGYAWGETIGWINFDPSHSQVTIDPATGAFAGYTWAENVGWIHFGNPDSGYQVAIAGSDDVTIAKTQELEWDRGHDPQTGDPFVWAGDMISYTITAENFFDTAVSMMISDTLNAYVDYVVDSLRVYEDGMEVMMLDQWEIMDYDALSDQWSLAYTSDPLQDMLLMSFDVLVETDVPLHTLILNYAEVTAIGGLQIDAVSNTVQVEVVPEPATVIFVGIGLLGLVVIVRRR